MLKRVKPSLKNVAKNLLCENTCLNCNHVREVIQIKEIKSFPYKIPYAYSVIEMEKCTQGIRYSVMIYLKEGNVYIGAEDYNNESKYFLHMICKLCEMSNLPIPQELSCEYFQKIK